MIKTQNKVDWKKLEKAVFAIYEYKYLYNKYKYLYYCIRKKNFSQISQENVGLFEDERTWGKYLKLARKYLLLQHSPTILESEIIPQSEGNMCAWVYIHTNSHS